MTAKKIIDTYIAFFTKRGHIQISSASLIPQNDPTTLFTSSGMQPLVSYLLGEPHPQGKRLTNVQNCFRAADIDEVGDNRHTTFFRMLGNWSLGDYFKKEQLLCFFEFLAKKDTGLGIDPSRLYVSVFAGLKDIPKDEESAAIWGDLFESVNINPNGRIFFCGVDDNWWSRSGAPNHMPSGEPGGPDSEVYFDLDPSRGTLGTSFRKLSDSGRLLEIGNSVFMQYQKQQDGSFKKLPQQNVDFGAGLERLLMVLEGANDMFQTSLFTSIIRIIEVKTERSYKNHTQEMRIVADHLTASVFMIANGISPSNKEQGYVLRRLIRRGIDSMHALQGEITEPVIEAIIQTYQETDPLLVSSYERIKLALLDEQSFYVQTLKSAQKIITKKYRTIGTELKGQKEISSEDAFILYTTHGLAPTQIKSLGFVFDEKAFAEKMKAHQSLSRTRASQKFAGGLADQREKTIMGHTATHLLHQAIRDLLGNQVHQTGSNITNERVRFDFSYDKTLTAEQLTHIESIVNGVIARNLPVYCEVMPLQKAKQIGAIGLFDEKYTDKVNVYFIGKNPSYSIEFCGGPHVDFTDKLKSFKIVRQENLGKNQKRIYATVGN